MADKKISALTAATTPLAGTEVLPIVQSSTTVKVAVSDLTAGRSIAFTGFTAGTSALTTTNTILSAYGGSSNDYGVSYRLYSGATSTTQFGHDKSIFGGSSTDFSIYATTGNGFRVYTNGANQALTVNTSQDVLANAGNFIPSTAGKGVNFSANTPAAGMTSTLLNWYEEGTFTPTLIGTTTNPTVTYSIQRGRYTRVGRLVTVEVYMNWSALSGGSGNIAAGSLPYTIDGSTGASGGGSVSYFDGFTLSASRTSVGIQAVANTTYVSPTCFGSGVSTQYIPVSSVASTGALIFTLTYSV